MPAIKSKPSFGKRIKEAMETEFDTVDDAADDIDNGKRHGEQAYNTIGLTERGQHLLDRRREE